MGKTIRVYFVFLLFLAHLDSKNNNKKNQKISLFSLTKLMQCLYLKGPSLRRLSGVRAMLSVPMRYEVLGLSLLRFNKHHRR